MSPSILNFETDYIVCACRCLPVIAEVVSAFRSAVHSVTEEKEGSTKYVVQGGAGMIIVYIYLNCGNEMVF